jgi:DNA-binding transcriptional MerR regulator
VAQVCSRVGIKPHTLRYWEREFELKPDRNSAGRRIYTQAQVERLLLIKHLVRHDRLTVAGARRQLAKTPAQPKPTAVPKDLRQTLFWLKKELVSIRALLADASR